MPRYLVLYETADSAPTPYRAPVKAAVTTALSPGDAEFRGGPHLEEYPATGDPERRLPRVVGTLARVVGAAGPGGDRRGRRAPLSGGGYHLHPVGDHRIIRTYVLR